jgi:hypothetical protein
MRFFFFTGFFLTTFFLTGAFFVALGVAFALAVGFAVGFALAVGFAEDVAAVRVGALDNVKRSERAKSSDSRPLTVATGRTSRDPT